jgi:hypothetical protein
LLDFDVYGIASIVGAAGATYAQNKQFGQLADDYAQEARYLADIMPLIQELE